MKNSKALLLIPFAVALIGLNSCGDPTPANVPTIHTPSDAKVNLANISLAVSNAKITKGGDNKYNLSFDYTITNTTGSHLSFISIYNNSDYLIDVSLSDKEGEVVPLGRDHLNELTLAQPRPLKFRSGETTRPYKTPVKNELRAPGDPITLRVRLHAPSRYDELRSTIEAPMTIVHWP